MISTEQLAEKIAKDFGFPYNDVLEAIVFSDGTIDAVIEYCEIKKEMRDGKKTNE